MKKLLLILSKFWLPVVIWLTVIFLFSNFPVKRASEVFWKDFLLKKAAHFGEYAILFTLTYRAFRNTKQFSGEKQIMQAAVWSFVFTLLYAISDEFHQTFIPGRTGTLRDVVIDGAGALFTWLVIWKYLPKTSPRLKKLAKNLQLIS